jgi:hypothetical protein
MAARSLTFGERFYFGFIHLFRVGVVCMLAAGWIIIAVVGGPGLKDHGFPLLLALGAFGAVFSLGALGLFWFATWMLKQARERSAAGD